MLEKERYLRSSARLDQYHLHGHPSPANDSERSRRLRQVEPRGQHHRVGGHQTLLPPLVPRDQHALGGQAGDGPPHQGHPRIKES